jgi:hypothetical protein
MHHNLQKHMVPKIYVQFYCVMNNLTDFKHDARNKTGLDISISKAQFCQICLLIFQVSTFFMLIYY